MLRNQPTFKYALLIMDILILSISFAVAYQTVFADFHFASPGNLHRFLEHTIFYFLFLAAYVFSFWNNNLYKRNIVYTRYRHLILLAKAVVTVGILAILFMVLYNVEYFKAYGKHLIFYFSINCLIAFLIFRVVIAREVFLYLSRKKIYRSRILIVGGDEAAKYVAGRLERAPSCEFVIVGFLDDYKPAGQNIYKHFNNLGKLDDLERVVNEMRADEILIAIDNAPYDRLLTIVEKSLQTGKVIRVYSNLLHVLAEKLKVEFYADVPVIMLSQLPLVSSAWRVKRIFDIVVSGLALLLLSPLFLVIAVGIKLSSKGPVIFKQTRIGQDGRPFDFYKFRSMHVNGDDSGHRQFVTNLIKNGNNGKPHDIRVFKITEDPRIFKFGKFIRKTSFDEFPQFFNVLKGDMSLVGPRPCLPYEWDCYSEWHKKRLNAPSGCTGLWQALGRSVVTFEEMVILDLYYISNMTPWLDMRIMLQTIPVIFFAKGAH